MSRAIRITKAFVAVGILLAMAGTATAQESTAGQATDAQVNWSALSNRINLLDTQNKALTASLNKVLTCNAKKMAYAPTAANKDSDGCTNPLLQFTGKNAWFGSQGIMPGATNACPSTADHAFCPDGWLLIGYDSCGNGKSAVYCAELKK